MAHHYGDAETSRVWSRVSNDLIARVCGLFPDNFMRRVPAAAVPGRRARRVRPRVGRRTRALRDRTRVRRLPAQPRPVRRVLAGTAPDRPRLLPLVREDGGAGRARDGARRDVAQPGRARHLRALPQRRHRGVHAAVRIRSVHRLPDAAADPAARRRRGAVSLGPLPRDDARPRSAPVGRSLAGQRFLRHLRLPPARPGTAHRPHSRRERPVRLGNDRCRPLGRPGNRTALRRHPGAARLSRFPRPRRKGSHLRRQRAAGVPRLVRHLDKQEAAR